MEVDSSYPQSDRKSLRPKTRPFLMPDLNAKNSAAGPGQGLEDVKLAVAASVDSSSQADPFKLVSHHVEVHVAGVIGAAIAGSTFTLLCYFTTTITHLSGDGIVSTYALSPLGISASESLAVGAFGFLWTGVVAGIVVTLIASAAAFCGFSHLAVPITTFSCGLAGTLSSMLLSILRLTAKADPWAMYALIAWATVMCQLCAWISSRIACQLNHKRLSKLAVDQTFSSHQLTLGQLFRITTVVAIATACLAALKLPIFAYQLLTFGLAVQAVVFGIMWLLRRACARHNNSTVG